MLWNHWWNLVCDLQPACARTRTFLWMSLCLAGMTVRKDLLGVTSEQYTASQMTYDLRRLRLKGLIFRPPKTHRYFLTPHGWKIARLFSRLEARVFRPAFAMFTSTDAVLPFPLRASLNRVDAQLDELIYQAFPQAKAS